MGENERYEITGFTNPMLAVEKCKEFNLIFLDLEMPETDGIEIGKRIKEQNPECRIIMSTKITDRFKETFQLSPLRYITKPFIQEEITEAIEAYFNTLAGYGTLKGYINKREYELPIRKISFVHILFGMVKIKCKGNEYNVEGSIDYYEKLLDSRLFFRVNRQYIINKLFIQKYDKGIITIEGEKIKVSRARIKEFEKFIYE